VQTKQGKLPVWTMTVLPSRAKERERMQVEQSERQSWFHLPVESGSALALPCSKYHSEKLKQCDYLLRFVDSNKLTSRYPAWASEPGILKNYVKNLNRCNI